MLQLTGNQETQGSIPTEKFSHFPKLGKLVESFLTFFISFQLLNLQNMKF